MTWKNCSTADRQFGAIHSAISEAPSSVRSGRVLLYSQRWRRLRGDSYEAGPNADSTWRLTVR
jgi:hypothetical protein